MRSERAVGAERAAGRRPGNTYTVIVSIEIEVYFSNPVERGAAERKTQEETFIQDQQCNTQTAATWTQRQSWAAETFMFWIVVVTTDCSRE